MLSDQGIRDALDRDEMLIEPYNDEQLQPTSYDVVLHRRLLVLASGGPLDPRRDTSGNWWEVDMTESGFVLAPGQFVLGSTVERVRLGATVVAQLEGKSSLGRLGLQVHSTAGFIDPGFRGQITLELSCTQNRGIVLYPWMPIGQIAFSRVDSPVQRLYQGKYSGQDGPTLSKYHLNWRRGQWTWNSPSGR